MNTALTIAGSDSSGGAGIQADIKTMTANRVYAMSAITALTAQNTTGVTDIMEVTPKFLAEQLDSIFTDINPDAIKTGMVSSSELIETIADKLTETARYASEHGFSVFTTTLASSRWKSLKQINEAGRRAAALYPDTLFWEQNWRKGGLQERRNQLLKEYDFYNQQYCGCEFSMQRLEKNETI